MDNNRRLYDSRAESYAAEWYPNALMLPTIREFLGALSLGKPRVLDLGCGPGNESMRLAREGAEVTGLDFSGECIRIARERNPGLRFLEMDYFDITEAIGHFDGIFACSSLIHLKDDVVEAVLGLLRKVLAPKGLVLDLYMTGDEQRITYPMIDGEKVERICERRTPERQNGIYARNGFAFVKDVHIDESIRNVWRASLYRLVDDTGPVA